MHKFATPAVGYAKVQHRERKSLVLFSTKANFFVKLTVKKGKLLS